HRGWFGNCATFDDGSPTCWGGNIRGELGLGNTDNVGDDGGEMGDALPDFAAGLAVTAVLGGYHVWCVIDDARALRCLGRNDLGQLGVGDAVNHGGNAGETWAAQPPIDLGTGRTLRGTSDHNIAHGLEHVCALTDDFRIRCWGSNNLGQLFVGDTD
ncbi:MAG: hypothetical protein GWN07_21220, partial [Actinobacteria bacterium]|nr:hypothetical protein [Actinomycetota bacterium]NIS32985.1 hypothetical protein [Actinomycetota bacterium]NIU64936.1 hypothetical protein [Actinomycetota bacterium]NIW29708.1 hypothetical protein [Actinomycetota bacterium]NIX22211.1 hypothetical protein [Actinomycetota bacterium]